jgi:hypothetical protein
MSMNQAGTGQMERHTADTGGSRGVPNDQPQTIGGEPIGWMKRLWWQYGRFAPQPTSPASREKDGVK